MNWTLILILLPGIILFCLPMALAGEFSFEKKDSDQEENRRYSFKGRKFRRLRKKALATGYYSERRKLFSDRCKYWDHFHTFECNSFFVGEEKASYNFDIYYKNYPRAKAKYEWYTKKEKGNEEED